MSLTKPILSAFTYRSPPVPEKVSRKGSSLNEKSAFFINCGSVAVIIENYLIQALNENWIAGTALDVFNPEPPGSVSPVLHLENVILSPHNAVTTKESAIRVALGRARGIDDVLSGT
ncbi:hypothetical protein B4O97_09365 [Marispirochaeta aestuarii]|uniref:D-isomer specific 2-hydroxyacid dehydrogenase NAD-binding domain-containing protein n=1 Tax=Marispirochaeta aestuarii TaxID=1963862 RepID=A0A1Y1RYB3_9SPIO|nr:hypothetical protein B4O97_09365 [Marispirochaeta aestuarii]